jgi:hypothetical protein
MTSRFGGSCVPSGEKSCTGGWTWSNTKTDGHRNLLLSTDQPDHVLVVISTRLQLLGATSLPALFTTHLFLADG